MNKLVSRLVISVALCASSLSVVLASASPAFSIADSAGLMTPDSGTCQDNGSIGATSSSWNWAKPTIEVSANGTTWNNAGSWSSATGKQYGAQVCREIRTGGTSFYWFIIRPATGTTDDMGAEGLTLTFRITVPVKSGDNVARLAGYSNVLSYSESNGTFVVVTKASPVAKIDYGNASSSDSGLAAFKVLHPECATFTMRTIQNCSISKASSDKVATIIQHADFFTSALSDFRKIQKGLWIAANVNGYAVNLSCAGVGTDTDSSSSYSGGTTGSYTGNTDNGANIPSGSTSATLPTTSSLEIAVTGTPHFKADGVTLNSGNLQAFIPKETATKCFSDGTSTTTLDVIAKNLTVTRTETSVSSLSPAFTAVVVTTPAEGILVVVETMTFSDPKYTLASLLKSASVTPTLEKTPTSVNTVSNAAKLKVVGKTATISVTLSKKSTFKIYRKLKSRLTLVKTVSGKVGINKVTTPYAAGYSYVVIDSKKRTLATLSK